MKYGDKEIENAVVINGKLYEVTYREDSRCIGCDLLFKGDCCFGLCRYFEEKGKNVNFRRLVNSQFLNLHEDEKG